MPRYLRQIHAEPPTDVSGRWHHLKADTERDAAIAGLDPSKFFDNKLTVMVALDDQRNRWPNGRPMCVKQFTLELERN